MPGWSYQEHDLTIIKYYQKQIQINSNKAIGSFKYENKLPFPLKMLSSLTVITKYVEFPLKMARSQAETM